MAAQLVPPGSFCWNPACPDYAQLQRGNLRRFGTTRAGVQRYQCKTCHQTFTETKGTPFYGCKTPPAKILECLALLAGRASLAAIHRVQGVKEETVTDWLLKAARHVATVEALLLAHHRVSRAQLDALWAYAGAPAGPGQRRHEAVSRGEGEGGGP